MGLLELLRTTRNKRIEIPKRVSIVSFTSEGINLIFCTCSQSRH